MSALQEQRDNCIQHNIQTRVHCNGFSRAPLWKATKVRNSFMKNANLPDAEEVFLDHSGHFVANAEAAQAALANMGFTVTPLSKQVQPDPETGEARLTGTGNICIMLPEGYLEFLIHTADTTIGLEFKAALERRAGLHLAAFGVADTESLHARLAKAGFDMRPLVHFSRDIETEAARETAAFTVARLAAGVMPEGRVQFLTHHNPSALWQTRWTTHDNGAQSLRAMVLSAPDPEEAASRYARLFDRPAQRHGAALRITLDRGALEILPEETAAAIVGTHVELGRSCFVGLRIGMADTATLAGLSGARWIDGSLALPFDPALGAGVWLFDPV
ncbi:VOC family protein [Sedimentitalea sp. JM2-8]|uniref:VOC family protein n=1 Tax=Sedimentitalea xiamensis TaxID=3050037 RepID=A0ABT7FGU1_9RHOB|nr:VOC family protein [Sedimentitalea xiamensis]MDK3074346.1 VOC family protein [Sedimentitalea xiamensis]